jgi:thymidylate synthase (FAD)
MESTRYCNYSKGKFGQEITVIEPCFYKPGSGAYAIWKEGCEQAEKAYFKLIALDRKAQEARDNLPTSVKTDLIMTATENEWQHIINLRYHGTTGAPHPQMKEVMSIAYPLLVADSEGRLA